MTGVLSLWFGLRAPVSRRAYVVSGIVLMIVKVAIDNALMFVATGKPWPILAYLLPSLVLKNDALGPQPTWVHATMALSTLPFLWIGISMSVRRAADAGISPWFGALFFVPILNYAAMLWLSIAKSAPDTRWSFLPPSERADPAHLGDGVRSALVGVLVSASFGGAMVAISIYALRLYGTALFFATPFMMGMTSAVVYNQRVTRSLGYTILVSLAGITMAGSAILLFGIEGVVCLAMAFPIAAVITTLGAILGWALATQTRAPMRSAMMIVLACGPGSLGLEHETAKPRLREVSTSIEIDAPPETVWKHVIGFSELPAPPAWFFRLGIAYPMRANIDGEGVGAVRNCEFSTGPFVEPITVWDPPQKNGNGKLAFDVRSQPPSMTELSPYKTVNAPHLEGYMVSRRGEFRLVRLPGNRTRLEGSTFYTLALYPEAYWVIWGEVILHSIHTRVLEHIKRLSEVESSQ